MLLFTGRVLRSIVTSYRTWNFMSCKDSFEVSDHCSTLGVTQFGQFNKPRVIIDY